MAVDHHHAVVVGSGFGGSVAAYRLAEAGRTVLLLERGKAYPPGEFPRTPHRMRRNFWDPSEGLQGLYNVWSFSGIDALVSSGLGGGSLIYANVLLRKDERWFVHQDREQGGYEDWPITRTDLDPHYDRVERMLGAARYPVDHEPYASTPKTEAFREAAETSGLDWFLPPLAVTFASSGEPPRPGEPIREEHPNLHGRTRTTCRLCGECDIGCNLGSKNTLDLNYLSAAARLGATLRTRCEVRSFAPREGGGYRVSFVQHSDESEGDRLDTHDPALLQPQEVTCDRLVLGAGALGTTFLLLHNRGAFPRLSPRVGSGFSGNGDLLTFALKAGARRDGDRFPRIIDPSFGPVITSAVRVSDRADGGDGRGFYLEDAGFPVFGTWMLQLVDGPGTLWRATGHVARMLLDRLGGRRDTDLGAEVADLLESTELSAGVLPLLGMGRDIPDGRMSLRDGRLDIDWTTDSSLPYFERVREAARQMSDALGADFLDNPSWDLSRVITVHPLGGARMGRGAEEGVVDDHGEVFGHPGLFVADGAAMPGAVGPNPSLTIAAHADRVSDRMLDEG